jgi:hypothetical protein
MPTLLPPSKASETFVGLSAVKKTNSDQDRALLDTLAKARHAAGPLLRIIPQPRHAAQRPDCVAGHAGLELRNVDANYLFERSHGLRESS